MDLEPITLFSRTIDPAAVARRLRKLDPSLKIDGPDDDWRNAIVTFEGSGQRRSLTFTHDPSYYSEPNWSTQMAGMRGYFSGFPESGRKSKVLTLTTSLRFSMGTLFEPDFDPEGDPRLDVVFAIAELLDGVLFTSSSLRDASGRILFSADGEEAEDPEAVWPRVLGEVSIAEPFGAALHEMSRPGSSNEDEEVETQPPTPERVARRALALTAVTARAILEQDGANPETEETYRDLLAWVEEIGIDPEFEEGEREVVHRNLGDLDPSEQTNSTWRLEGLVVLAWALGRFEMPPPDRLVELNPLWRSLGLLDSDAAKALLESPELRPPVEIEALRNRLFAVHWRLRSFHLNRKVMDFAEYAQTCWFGPLDISGLPLVEGDLGLEGDRLDRASGDDFSRSHSAAQERHQAANWLREGPETYSEASVAT
jgi:hypothetical protein